jgi:hypothetical protein
MSCNCLICRTGHDELANELLASFELSIVFKKLKSKIKNLQLPILETHCENLGIVPVDESKQIKLQVHKPNFNDRLNFGDYRFDKNNPVEIIEYIQSIQLKLYLLQSEITLEELQNYKEGKSDNLPIISVINQKRFLDMLEQCSGLKILADQEVALKVVKNLGIIENVDP